MNGIGSLGRLAGAEIIFLFGLLFAFFARDIRFFFYKGNQQIWFHGSEKYSGFPLWLQGRTRNGDGRISLQHSRSAATIMLVGFGAGAGVKPTFLYFFVHLGIGLAFYPHFLHCVLVVVSVNRSGRGSYQVTFLCIGFRFNCGYRVILERNWLVATIRWGATLLLSWRYDCTNGIGLNLYIERVEDLVRCKGRSSLC